MRRMRRRRNEWETVSGVVRVVGGRFCSGLASRKPCHMMTRYARHDLEIINVKTLGSLLENICSSGIVDVRIFYDE